MRKIVIFIFSICLFSCSTKLSIEGFNKNEWKNYKKNCSNYRKDNVTRLMKNPNYLLSRTQNEIEDFLGAPDEHELYTRNQKFFHYYIFTPKCKDSLKINEVLSIRFNALGRSSNIQLTKRRNL